MASTERHPDLWAPLQRELDAWAEAEQTATLWWRDDDATSPSDALSCLLDTASDMPLAVAVIPQPASTELGALLDSRPNVSVLQHGYAHTNHAPATEKKTEFGPHRPTDLMCSEIERGRSRLHSLFPKTFRPVFVPPWNRIGADIISELGGLGFRANSTFGSLKGKTPLPHVNVHVDIIDWRGSRGFVGTAQAVQDIAAHLAARRGKRAAQFEATGLMTHHLDHDKETWRFLARLLELTRTHPASDWIGVDTLLETLS
ncbi:MAG: polysaccharide deacetylase family protein [Rickettsiales bacterium]|jgi:hypothetical protein